MYVSMQAQRSKWADHVCIAVKKGRGIALRALSLLTTLMVVQKLLSGTRVVFMCWGGDVQFQTVGQ